MKARGPVKMNREWALSSNDKSYGHNNLKADRLEIVYFLKKHEMLSLDMKTTFH